MIERKFFGTNALIDDFTKKLTEVESFDSGWSTKYLDNETGMYWLKYVIDDRGFFKNLMFISPSPTTDELIHLALTSKYPDEVSAASTRLNIEEEIHKKEFRQALLDRLNSIDIFKINKPEKERIKSIIQASQLTNKVNKRNIIGKDISEIEKDAAFFNSMANTSQKILNNL